MILKLFAERDAVIKFLSSDLFRREIGNWQELTCLGYKSNSNFLLLFTDELLIDALMRRAYEFEELKPLEWFKLSRDPFYMSFTFTGNMDFVTSFTIYGSSF